MGSYFSGMFGAKGKQTQQPATALRITTSLQGVPLPWLLGGQQRAPGNLIGYGGFGSTTASSGGKGAGSAALRPVRRALSTMRRMVAGKGGVFGGQSQSGQTYFASVMLAFCEGPDIQSILFLYFGGSLVSFAQVAATTFVGDYAQTPWPVAEVDMAAAALAYRGIAYVAMQNLNLGSSPSLPQINGEILSTNSYVTVGAGQPDGDPSVCWTKFFTDALRGLQFPAFRMGSLTAWQQYCFATGMLVSPLMVSAVAASSWARDILAATNSNARWSAGLLTVVPYGDQAITAGQLNTITETHVVPTVTNNMPTVSVQFVTTFVSDVVVTYSNGLPFARVFTPFNPGFSPAQGQYIYEGTGTYIFADADFGQEVLITYSYASTASYQPNNTPIYSLTIDNFIENQGTIGSGLAVNNSPLIVVRKPRDQMLNVVKLTYLDRGNNYNPVTISAKNEAAIQAFGRWRADSPKTYDFFCLGAAAQQSAALQLQREQIARTFQFTLSKLFILLDVMDIVEVTDPDLSKGIVSQAVRITEIQESTDSSLTFTAEEFLGTAAAPLYNIQPLSGFVPNFNEAPGNAATPIIFEPTDELGGGLEVWAAVCGQDLATWGGYYAWLSLDGDTYQSNGEAIVGSARMGVTTADFPAASVNATGQTIDQTNTLSVDLTVSEGELASGTALDATSLNTACYVGGEIVAYETATLTAQFKYGLTYLVRGAYGTEDEIVDHPIGTPFARLDNAIFKFPYNQSQIGQTVYIKFQGFNPYGGGLQELSECTAYPYTITGSALSSPLPDVTDLYSNYEAGFQKIYWDEITDFRNGILYEIRQGTIWNSALFIRSQAHPPFIAQGNGTFLIKARCQPVAGLIVYSEDAASIEISGNQLSLNLLAGFDEQATGWTGTFQNGIGIDGGDIRLGGAGNILGVNPLLQSATTASATPSGNVLALASLPGNLSVGMAVADTTTSGRIPALATAIAIGAGVIDYGSVASPATVDVDYGSVATSATVTIDYGLAVTFPVTLSAPVAGGGVLAGDTIVFSTPDVLDLGGIVTNTPVYYTIPTGHIINAGSVVQASVNGSTQITGVPVGQNILSVADFLNSPDVLGSASTQYVDGWIEIATSQDGVTWGPWQKFVPGVFPAMAWNFRLALESSDPNSIPYATAFNYQVQLPSRIDHYQQQSIGSGGTTITFARDNAPSTPAAFNGGPGSNDLPYVSVSWQPQAGDYYTISGLSLSQLTIQFFNSSAPVARSNVNIDVEGY